MWPREPGDKGSPGKGVEQGRRTSPREGEEMTHRNDEGGAGGRGGVGRGSRERKQAKWEEREGTDGGRRCREVQEREKGGKEQEIRRKLHLAFRFVLFPLLPLAKGGRGIQQNCMVCVLVESSHRSCQVPTLHGSSFYFYILQN